MISFQKFLLRNKNISVLKFISNYFYVGYDDGILQKFTEDFHLLFQKKIHPCILFNIYQLDTCFVTFSLSETCLWDFNWKQKKKFLNVLFHRICPLHEEKIIFGSISGDLFSWNQKELISLPYHFHRPSITHLLKINKKQFLSYNPTELILWEKEEKKNVKKKEKDWISTIEIFDKEHIFIGYDSISLLHLPTFEIKKKWSTHSSIFTSILSLDRTSFLSISITGYIYLYHIEKNTEECLQKGLEYPFFPVSFVQTKKDIFFFYEQSIFQFQNPVLKKEQENYNLFLNSIQNLKKDYIFHNRDISSLLSSFLY